ncbi:MAG: cupredoxin domain-containing protein [Solirubrobacteraceae bacterium]
MIAIPVAAVVAVGVAGVSGAFSASGGTRTGAPATTAAVAQMPMPAAPTGASGPLRVALHQRVVDVKIMNFAFMPARVEVSSGTRVVWTNEDSDPHTVTTDEPGFSSQALDTGQAYMRVMGKAGTFAYHCTIHPFMHGTVVVEG